MISNFGLVAMKYSCAIISGYYGTDEGFGLKHKVKKYPCYFVTNNLHAAERARELGWIVAVDESRKISSDKSISTMQGKCAKTNPSDFFDLDEYDYLLWVDDKLNFSENMLIKREICNLRKNRSLVSLRTHWNNDGNIWQELALSIKQIRYRKHLLSYLKYIDNKIEGGYSENGVMSACGVILRVNKNNHVNQMFTDWSDEIKSSGLLNDQISFFFVRQKYKDIISEMDYPINHYQASYVFFKNLIKRLMF